MALILWSRIRGIDWDRGATTYNSEGIIRPESSQESSAPLRPPTPTPHYTHTPPPLMLYGNMDQQVCFK